MKPLSFVGRGLSAVLLTATGVFCLCRPLSAESLLGVALQDPQVGASSDAEKQAKLKEEIDEELAQTVRGISLQQILERLSLRWLEKLAAMSEEEVQQYLANRFLSVALAGEQGVSPAESMKLLLQLAESNATARAAVIALNALPLPAAQDFSALAETFGLMVLLAPHQPQAATAEQYMFAHADTYRPLVEAMAFDDNLNNPWVARFCRARDVVWGDAWGAGSAAALFFQGTELTRAAKWPRGVAVVSRLIGKVDGRVVSDAHRRRMFDTLDVTAIVAEDLSTTAKDEVLATMLHGLRISQRTGEVGLGALHLLSPEASTANDWVAVYAPMLSDLDRDTRKAAAVVIGRASKDPKQLTKAAKVLGAEGKSGSAAAAAELELLLVARRQALAAEVYSRPKLDPMR